MSDMMDAVDQRTSLAGHNRLELLLFQLNDHQLYGINVFKVNEVIRTPELTRVGRAHPAVRGVAAIRGGTISIIDLNMAAVGEPLETDDDESLVIVTQYNRSIQGFVISSADRIVNLNWEDIYPPPGGASGPAALTGVTRVDEQLVQILDVERLLAEIVGSTDEAMEAPKVSQEQPQGISHRVLVADDSPMAQKKIKKALTPLGLDVVLTATGEEALSQLQEWTQANGGTPPDDLLMVISDIEMPRMDGYTLTRRIRETPALQNLYVMLHTSLSGVFNEQFVERVGADSFLAKFAANELAQRVSQRLQLVAQG